MKKKIEALLRDGSLAGNAEYEALHKSLQSTKRALERAKTAKSDAKSAYQDALGKDEKDDERLFELLTVFRQAKCMQQFHRAAFKLVKHKLHRWLESYLKNVEVPHEPIKVQTVKTKAPKSASGKMVGKQMSGKAKMPKTAEKAVAKPAKKGG